MNSLMRNGLVVAACLVWAAAHAQDATVAGEVSLDVRRFTIEGENPLSESETNAILAPYVKVHKSLDGLEEAAEALENEMRRRGFSFHRVIVPAQKPVGGEIKLQVVQFVVDKIVVTGNEHFSSENILASVPGLQLGKAPDLRATARDLAIVNEHPSKRVTLVFKESENPDAVDAELRVRDVPPVQTFLGFTYGSRDIDNQLNKNTGYTRLTLGHQRTNLFDRDHAFTFTYTTSPDHLSDVTQAGVFYWLPIYGYDSTLSFWGIYSDVDSGVVNQSFNVTGRGQFYGLRYTYLLPKVDVLRHSLALSAEDKYFDTRVTATGLPSSEPVRSRPLTLRYQGQWEPVRGSVGFFADYVFNMRGGGANNAKAYAGGAPGTPGLPVPQWDAWRYGGDLNFGVGTEWNLAARLRGQYAMSPLIPGEQFGLGGIGSVRGLKDREVSGERGYVVTIEATGPMLIEELQPVVFYDQGSVTAKTLGTLRSYESAASLGAGLRWNWRRQLDLSADLAHVLNGVNDLDGTSPASRSSHNKLYFSLFYRF